MIKPIIEKEEIIFYPIFNPSNIVEQYNPCDRCPNNSKNGGSGFCNCTLPYLYGPNRIIY